MKHVKLIRTDQRSTRVALCLVSLMSAFCLLELRSAAWAQGTSKGDFELNRLSVGEYSSDDENYVYFDGAPHLEANLPYISLGDSKLVLGCPPRQFGSTIQLLPGNPYVDVTDGSFLMIQVLGGAQAGYLVIEKKKPPSIVRVTSFAAGYNIFNGEKVVKYNDKAQANVGGPSILNVNPITSSKGKAAIPLQLVTGDGQGKRALDWDIVFDRHGRILAGTATELEKNQISQRLGVYTSISQAFHDLSQTEQDQAGGKAPNGRVAPPAFSRDRNTMWLNGREYRRIPGTSKYVSKSGETVIVN